MKIHLVNNKGKEIKCELRKRKNSKNMRMQVNPFGTVKVSLPYYTPYNTAKKFINNNLDWIEKKINMIESQKNTYYYLGKNIRLIKKNCANIKSFNYILNGTELIVEIEDDEYSDYDLYIRFLREMACIYIPKKVEEFSKEYLFDYNQVKIKNLNSRWGSCSFKKNLSFNLKLMYFNYKVIDYVIVHELCHLREMNHSKRFWKFVENILPNYKEYRSQLNKTIH